MGAATATVIVGRLEIDRLELVDVGGGLVLDELGRVHLRLGEAIDADDYATNRTTGGATLIDETTHDTVAAVLIEDDDR